MSQLVEELQIAHPIDPVHGHERFSLLDSGSSVEGESTKTTTKETRMSRKRVLCLHGYHGNASVLRSQMGSLTDGFSSEFEFVPVNAPSIAQGDFGWWHGAFALWNQPFRGWERTRDWVVKLFAEQEFDGVFGFSQGAALTGLLVGMRAPDGQPSEAAPLRFDFAMTAGGFVSNEPGHASLYAATAGHELPSLHMMGRSDTIVPIADSRRLSDRFSAPVVIEHSGGHIIPSTPAVREQVAEFFDSLP
jgi:predicted esterase